MLVSVGPGCTVLTVMPSDPRSRARPGSARHRRFGHAVDGCTGKAAAIRRDAAKGDHAAASTHVADRGLHGGKNDADIDREHPIEIGKLLFFDGTSRPSASVGQHGDQRESADTCRAPKARPRYTTSQLAGSTGGMLSDFRSGLTRRMVIVRTSRQAGSTARGTFETCCRRATLRAPINKAVSADFFSSVPPLTSQQFRQVLRNQKPRDCISRTLP
jgi:hypothetical protein